MLSFEYIKYFLEACDSGSIQAATKKLYLSSQGLGAGIQRLEKSLGMTLLIRSKSGVQPTQFGKEFYAYASKLAEDMRNYVKDMIAAEDQTRGLQTKAYEDALTKVKNKAAYDVEVERIERTIGGGKTAFGLAMIDLNYLKRTNDTYGHEQGNEAIRTLCHTICDVFKRSPVYRVGGDEFVVLLEGFDLEHIDALRACFEQALERMDAEEDPRKRVSAAAGYAVYDPNVDENVESVFKRADRQMYERKKQMKAERE